MNNTTTTATTARLTWTLTDRGNDVVKIHVAEVNSCEIFRLRSPLDNDTFIVFRGETSLGKRASLNAARKLTA